LISAAGCRAGDIAYSPAPFRAHGRSRRRHALPLLHLIGQQSIELDDACRHLLKSDEEALGRAFRAHVRLRRSASTPPSANIH
jgi:hypothetical protein